MELTINNVIKIVIGVVVIAVVVLGIYLGMTNYIIPYFQGLGPSDGDNGGNGGGGGSGAEICQGKVPVGYLDLRRTITKLTKEYFFISNNQKTWIYFKNGKVWENNFFGDDEIGSVVGNEIDIKIIERQGDAGNLHGKLKGGNQICEK